MPDPQIATTAPAELHSLDDITECLESVLKNSPADETEFVWLEVNRGYARRQGSRIDTHCGPELTILVRVIERGRVGSYRTGTADPGELADAVRLATAQSRVREPLSGLQHLPRDLSPLAAGPDGDGITDLWDPEVARLDPRRARKFLNRLPIKNENARLHWADARIAVFNSRDVRRQAAVTAVDLEIRTGRLPGAARATDAARRLKRIDPRELVDRARRHHGTGTAVAPPTGLVPVVLSPRASIALCDMLNTTSFSAKAYYDGTSFLREHINIQVFDRSFNLADDGTDPKGLPFPFDLEGTAKKPVSLIDKGAPKTPTLDQRQAAVLGLPPTAHAIGGNNARAENLFVLPGDADESELLRAADGGVWIGWLENLECHEPRRVHFRARVRGARQIRDGKLGAPVEDFVWSDGMLRAFSSLAAIGRQPVRHLGPDGYLGGISAPAIALNAEIDIAPPDPEPDAT